MTAKSILVDGQELTLGKRIGRGGEGEVFLLATGASRAVKIYRPDLRREREQKVRAMVSANLSNGVSSVAFPLAVAEQTDRAFAGFVMNLVSDHKPLHELYAPGSRKQHFPQASYRFLARSATNIAKSVAEVHSRGCVIGDINHSGILISPRATVCLIDADSFQFAVGSQVFGCKVGVPEYTPPELQGQRLDRVVRTLSHDRFGLAVVIFQLLFMGRHPFVGRVRRGEIPPLHEAIRDYRYVYSESRDVGMDQPPGTPDVDDFFPAVAKKFERAFSPVPHSERPSAAEWAKVLGELEKDLTECTENRLHHIPKSAGECAWCEMEKTLLTSIFIPFLPSGAVTQAFDPGANAFNIQHVWAAIERQVFPSEQSLLPRFNFPKPEPSEAAKVAAKPKVYIPWLQICAGLLSIFGWILIPGAFFIWIAIAFWALFSDRGSKVNANTEPFKARYVAASSLWQRAIAERLKRSGAEDFRILRTEMNTARLAYKNLGAEEKKSLEEYKRRRRELQLATYLDSFTIRQAKIRGIGPAKEAALASFGIDTAADVSLEKLLQVPGFGPVNSQGIVKWRDKLAARFIYNESPNAADRNELQRIRSGVESRATALRRQLSTGAKSLQAICQRAQQLASLDDPALVRIKQELEASQCDLEFLGIQLPPVPAYQARTASPIAHVAQSLPASRSPNCPRCSSSMVRRVARRGSRAGSAFWGCSRYPVCKGTQNI